MISGVSQVRLFFLFHIKLSLEKVKKSKIKISKEVICLFFAVDFNLFSGIFVSATFASSKFAIFYKTVKLPWENFNLVSLIFFLNLLKQTDSPATILLAAYFSCPANSVC